MSKKLTSANRSLLEANCFPPAVQSVIDGVTTGRKRIVVQEFMYDSIMLYYTPGEDVVYLLRVAPCNWEEPDKFYTCALYEIADWADVVKIVKRYRLQVSIDPVELKKMLDWAHNILKQNNVNLIKKG